MRYLGLVVLAVAVAACGRSDSSTAPAPSSVAGNWTSSLLSLSLAETGADVSGGGSFTDSGGGGCNFAVSGSYSAGTLTIGMGSTITCSGSFTGSASGGRIVGHLTFSYAPDASQARRQTAADITLVKQ